MDFNEGASHLKAPSAAYLEFQRGFVAAHPDVTLGGLFGMQALKIGSGTFLGGFAGGVVVKLGREDVDRATTIEGARSFDPSGRGRPMKAWVVIPETARHSWDEYAERAYLLARGNAV